MKQLKLLAFIFVMVSALVTPLTVLSSNAWAKDLADDGTDEGTPSCYSLGTPLDKGDMGGLYAFKPQDFIVTVLNRGEILVQATDPSKTILTNGGVTLERILGNGCVVRPAAELYDEFRSFEYSQPGESLFSFDEIRGVDWGQQISSVPGFLGPVNTNLITQMELTWIVKYEDGSKLAGNGDKWFVLKQDGWDETTRSTDSGTSLVITDIKNKENFNNTLIMSGSPGDGLVLTSSVTGFVYTQATTNDRLYLNLLKPNENYIDYPEGMTPQLLYEADDFVELDYYTKTGDPAKKIKVLGGKAQSDLAQEFPDIGASAANEKSCESEGGAFSFILCPLLGYANDGIQWLDTRITNMLDVNPEYYANDGNVHKAWASFRNIAYILLIPILLVMVIGTALGFSFVDAYTVKRALPRLIVAIIFIALSFELATLMVEVVSIVGRGLGGLIAQPFGGTDALTLQKVFAAPNGAAANLLWGGMLAWGGLAILSSVSLPIIGSLLLVAFLALLIIFVLLVLREIVILFLIIVAPIAILSWIFPGNDKLWKIWWQSFSKLLYLFPIIIGLLITGRAFASLINQIPTDETAVVLTMIKIVAYIGPFFFIPKAFQMAGGAFASLAGMANNTSRGVFDKERKKRGAMTAENKAKSDNFSRFSDRNKFTSGLNRTIGATRGKNLGGTVRGRKGINERLAAGKTNQGQEDLKNDGIYNANQNDDNFQIALANRELAQEKLEAAQRKVDDTSLSDEERQGARAEVHAREKGLNAAAQVKSKNSAGTKRAALNAWMKSGYNISEGREGYDEISRTVDSIAGGDMRARSAMMDEAQYHAKNAGHAHLGGINHGNGYDPMGGIQKAGLYQLAGGKTEAITAWGQDRIPSRDPVTGNPTKPLDKKAAIHYKELESMKTNTTGANQKEVIRQMKELEAQGISQFMKDPSGMMDPVTNALAMTTERIGIDKGRATTDPAYRASFTPEELINGFKINSRPQTNEEAAAYEARKYEQVDPNKL